MSGSFFSLLISQTSKSKKPKNSSSPFSFLKLPKNPRTKSNQTFKCLFVILPFSFQKTQEQNQTANPRKTDLGCATQASATWVVRPWPLDLGRAPGATWVAGEIDLLGGPERRDLGHRRDRPPRQSRTRLFRYLKFERDLGSGFWFMILGVGYITIVNRG